jgi:Big-like domain-containing protein
LFFPVIPDRLFFTSTGPLTANEELMPYFARLWGRDSRRRPTPARHDVEPLEGRAMLSGSAASLAASHAHITSITTLQSSLTTAVTASRITFTATVENASNDAPIPSGKVDFVVESPQKIVLGDVSLSKQGEASVATTQLTKIGDYQVAAQYTPSNPKVSASVADRVTVKVIPLPIDVPTVTTVVSAASKAEVGQHVPLLATVKDAGTGVQVNAGKVEPLKGKVEFFSDSPDPVLLAKVDLKKTDQASLATNKLKNVGPYQIQAVFVPAKNFFTGSTSAPAAVTITPTTLNAPTATSIQAVTPSVETGEFITLNATVQNSDSTLPNGVVEFVTVSPHPVVLNDVNATAFGQPVSFATAALQKVGTYQIEAKYLPNANRFAKSISAPVTVTVTPLTAASFRVTPVVRHGQLNKPVSFAVTALNAHDQPLTNYTGTVDFTSPTDSFSILPKAFYVGFNLTPSAPPTTGLASFPIIQYTFTPADQGSHTFFGGVTFGKAGAEKIQVTQSDDPKVLGRTTFAIE